jgi:hypothetical protein
MKFKLTNTAMKNIDNRSNSELIKVPSRQFPPSGWRSSNRFEPASQLTGIPVDFEEKEDVNYFKVQNRIPSNC